MSIIDLGGKRIVNNLYHLVKKDSKNKKNSGKKAKKELITVVGNEYCLVCCGGGKTEKVLAVTIEGSERRVYYKH